MVAEVAQLIDKTRTKANFQQLIIICLNNTLVLPSAPMRKIEYVIHLHNSNKRYKLKNRSFPNTPPDKSPLVLNF
jgi:hypothetical protein